MTKNNKLLLVVLTFIVVCVVGYALFSENITITGTATAKGDFIIESTCQPGIPSNMIPSVESYFGLKIQENGYKNDTCSFNGNKGTFSVAFEYPGAHRIFTVKFTNKGSITASFGEIIREYRQYCLADTCVNGEPTSSTPGVAKRLMLFPVYPVVSGIQIGDGDIIPYNDITNNQGKEFLDSNGNYILKPGNSVFYAVVSGVHSDIGFGDSSILDMSNIVDFIFQFEQSIE